MKNAIVIGASSGIGRELAIQLSEQGYRVCVTARREELLQELLPSLNEDSFIQGMDVSMAEESIRKFDAIAEKMGTVDLVIISAGTGFLDAEMPWENDCRTIEVNVSGFTAMANAAYHLFRRQGHGHLVGISSIAAVRGGATAAYNASKAYVSSYLEGLRAKAVKEKIDLKVTDIRPGLVDTDMAKGEGLFWVAPVPKAAAEILAAVKAGKRRAYITRRWGLIALLLKILPEAVYNRLM